MAPGTDHEGQRIGLGCAIGAYFAILRDGMRAFFAVDAAHIVTAALSALGR